MYGQRSGYLFPHGVEQRCAGCERIIVPRRNFVLMHNEQFVCASLNPESLVYCCQGPVTTVATFNTGEEAQKDLDLARMQGIRNILTQKLFRKEEGILRLVSVMF